MRHHQHRPAGVIDERVDIRGRVTARFALRRYDQVGGTHVRNPGQRAVARKALQAAPLEGKTGILDAPEEQSLQLLGPLPAHVGRNLQEFRIGKAGGRGVRHRKRFGMDADQMALEPGGEWNGAVEHPLRVLLILQNGDDGFESHDNPSVYEHETRTEETLQRRAWFRSGPDQPGLLANPATMASTSARAASRASWLRARTTSSVQNLPSPYFG